MPSARSPSVRWSSSNSSGVGRRIAGALLAVSALACPTRSSIPGEPLGTFSFQATQIDGGCPFAELPADGGFVFSGTFSVVDGGPEAYLTVDAISRRGSFDGQRFESTHPPLSEQGVPRTFVVVDGGCPENEFTVHETIRVVLLTQSQYAALDGGCSPAGGMAGAEAALDAGGPPPTRGPNGLDAVRACGLLLEDVQQAKQLPDGGVCGFVPCRITFTLDGEPQR